MVTLLCPEQKCLVCPEYQVALLTAGHAHPAHVHMYKEFRTKLGNFLNTVNNFQAALLGKAVLSTQVNVSQILYEALTPVD